jgi:hypothetical protein
VCDLPFASLLAEPVAGGVCVLRRTRLPSLGALGQSSIGMVPRVPLSQSTDRHVSTMELCLLCLVYVLDSILKVVSYRAIRCIEKVWINNEARYNRTFSTKLKVFFVVILIFNT